MEYHKAGIKRGTIQACDIQCVWVDEDDPSSFHVSIPNRVHHFQSDTSKECEEWVTAIQEILKRLKSQEKAEESKTELKMESQEEDDKMEEEIIGGISHDIIKRAFFISVKELE